MTSIVTGHDGRAYLHMTAARRTVFVTDQPHHRPASYEAHTGLAELVAWQFPHDHDGEAMAAIRLSNGRILPVRASAVRDADNVAARRILPRADAARRLA